MLNKDTVLSALGGVKYPGFEKDIVTFGFVKNIDITDNNVYVETEIVSSSKEVGDELKGAIEKAIQASDLGINPTNDGLDLVVLPDIAEFAVGVAKNKNQSVKKDFNKDEFTQCYNNNTYNSEFMANMQDAIVAGLEGTPYSVITYRDNNDQIVVAKVSGAQDANYYESIIDRLLNIK